MKHQLFIRLENNSDQLSWVKSGELESAITDVTRGSLEEAAAEAVGANVVVIVPAEDVLLTRTVVPGKKSRNVMRQAVPYLLEEQLADDVEKLHFSLGLVEGDEVAVAVVARELIDGWLTTLRSVGIDPHELIPETLLLPLERDAWTLLSCLDGRLLLRSGPQSGMAMDVTNARAILQEALEETPEEDRPSTLAIYECGELRMTLPDLDIEMTRAPMREEILSLLVAGYQTTDTINLLQGHYSRRERIGQYWRPWRGALGLMTALIVLQIATSVFDYQRLSTEKSRLWNEIVATYKQAFPNENNVPYPQRQMEEHLKRLRGGGSATGTSFSQLLAKSGQIFKTSPGLTIKRLNFKNGSLDVALTIGDLQKLDQLERQLTTSTSLSVEIVSATSRDKFVEARLRISEKGA